MEGFWKKRRIFPYIRKGRYFMNDHEKPESLLFETLPVFLKSWFMRTYICPKKIASWLINQDVPSRSQDPIITWIGHSTFLIQLAHVNILTDPIFGQPSLLFPRILPPGVGLDALPSIDLVLISHNHRDHMDAPTLHALKAKNPNIVVWVPRGDKRWFDDRGFCDTREYMWWDRDTFINEQGAKIECSFLPSSHWSQRGLFDKNKSLWGSWMIEGNGHTIYFAGDTAYHHHFLQIAEEFPSIDTALMPIGPCEPDPWMRMSHLNAQEAGRAFVDLNAHHFIPMHWGTFPFGDSDFEKPIINLRSWWDRQEIMKHIKKLHIPKLGQQCLFRKSLSDKFASLIMRRQPHLVLE